MIQTRIEKWEGYRGMGKPQDVEVPIVQVHDQVELSAWDTPVIGKVVHTDQKMVWCTVPVATPGGGPYVCSVFGIKKLWRNNEMWENKN